MLCSLMCEERLVATNLAIDPALLERAQQVGGERTKKATVTRALEEYIATRQRARIVDSFGTLDWDKTYDYQAERSRDHKLPPAS